MDIRLAREGDITAITGLYEKMYDYLTACGLRNALDVDTLPNLLKVVIKSRLCYLAVAENEGKLIGFIYASLNKPDRRQKFSESAIGVINDIFVENEFRGQGLADALCMDAESWMRENGVSLCRAEVLFGNTSGADFWEHRGYGDNYKTVEKEL